MYHRPRPEGPGLALYPPLGVNELTIPETHRRQPAAGRSKATDQGTALTASDQYTEGILRSVQAVCIVTYVVKCASNLHSYLCKRLLASSYQVRNLIALLVSYQVRNVVALLSSYQVRNVVALLVSYQVRNVVALLVTYQVCNLITLLPIIKSDSINVRNMLTIYYLCYIFYSV